jgi:hypothetical protein
LATHLYHPLCNHWPWGRGSVQGETSWMKNNTTAKLLLVTVCWRDVILEMILAYRDDELRLDYEEFWGPKLNPEKGSEKKLTSLKNSSNFLSFLKWIHIYCVRRVVTSLVDIRHSVNIERPSSSWNKSGRTHILSLSLSLSHTHTLTNTHTHTHTHTHFSGESEGLTELLLGSDEINLHERDRVGFRFFPPGSHLFLFGC